LGTTVVLFCINCFISSDLRLVEQEHAQQGAVNLYAAVVADEAELLTRERVVPIISASVS
jgi:hypothetical protein